MSSSEIKVQPGQFLEFKLQSQSYAVEIGNVFEILSLIDITPVPQTNGYVAGVMNLRGRVIPVIDLRTRLGLERSGPTRQTCIIVADTEAGQSGMIVDAVVGVLDLTQDQIDPSPDLARTEASSQLVGIAKTEERVILLLDLDETFSSKTEQAEVVQNAA